LKSVAKEKFQLFSMQSTIPLPRSFPRTYGVPGRNTCIVPDLFALSLESSLLKPT